MGESFIKLVTIIRVTDWLEMYSSAQERRASTDLSTASEFLSLKSTLGGVYIFDG